MNSTSDRLRRATQLWHAYLAITGERFELAQFLQDAAYEKQTITTALASGDQKLIGLAQEWLLGTGQATAANVPARSAPAVAAPAAAEAPKPARYLRGVR
ncbi:MAG: hypothetical protein WDO72_01445 [Pseudomonadota bacterium]